MNQIRPWLYIGKWRETVDTSLLRLHKITALLHLASDVRHPDMECRYIAVEDAEPLDLEQLAEGVRFITEQHARGATIMVACGAGISRSTTFLLAGLKAIEGQPLLDTMLDIQARHIEALPHPLLWEALCQYFNENVPFIDML